MIILGIETSCDETAISIIEAKGDLDSLSFKLLGSAVNSQIQIHSEYGGVVPNLAKREHQRNLLPVLIETLKKAGFEDELWDMNYELWKEKYPKNKFPIDLITVTVGPGLEPALWTGIAFAEELGKSWGKAVIATNHMEGHIASVLLSKTEANTKSEIGNSKSFGFRNSNFEFPAVALLISGGHTELIYLKNWREKEKIGETQDDAVGEAFDKVARMLGLPYPGGPEISALAEQARNSNIQIRNMKFPRPMLHSKDFNFSFSGLKTSVLYYIKKITPGDLSDLQKMEIAREFEDAVIETLLSKTKKAIIEYWPKTLIIGGGVIANKALQENFLNLKEDYPELEILIPEKSLTTDNATMIAMAGYIEYLINGNTNQTLRAQGNLDIN